MKKKRAELDLLIINVLIVSFLLIIFTDSIPWLRVVLGLLVLFLFPGYVFISALYPKKDSLSRINRMALSLGLSLVIIISIGLILNYLPWGIKLLPLSLSISIFILSLSVITWYIRGRYHPDERYGITIKPPDWNLIDYFGSLSRAHFSLIIFTICLIVGFAVVLSYTLAKPPEKPPFTEFYILGVENRADNYPLDLEFAEEGAVIIGIVNHEHETTNYRLEVVVDENKLYELFPIVLEPEEKWHREVKFTPEHVIKRQKVEFRLNQDVGQPDEIRYIWVDVKA